MTITANKTNEATTIARTEPATLAQRLLFLAGLLLPVLALAL